MSARPAARSGGAGSWDCWDRKRPNPAPGAARRRRGRSREWSGSASCSNFRRWRNLAEQTKEIRRGLVGYLLQRDAARFGQHLGDFNDIRRLVALAAKLAGRQIWRVGLDYDAIGGEFGCEFAQRQRFLEGQ